jgi:hypothetical protein
MFLPPGPMIAPIFSTSTLVETTLGAYSEISAEGTGDRPLHDGEDVQPAALGLGEGLLEYLHGDARDLDVHLEARDAPRRARDLEVHVAEVVLVAENVGEDRVARCLR